MIFGGCRPDGNHRMTTGKGRYPGTFFRWKTGALPFCFPSMSDEVIASCGEGRLEIQFRMERLDAAAAARAKDVCQSLPGEGVDQVAIDLEPIRFIDSSGVGLILGIYRRLPSENVEVRLVNVAPAVRSVLELLRLHRVFVIE